jgi:hypothetical protein
MKYILIALLFCLSLPSWANKKGIGISLGNPTGLNGKYWLTNDTAVDGGLAFSFGKHTDVSIHSDYLFHKAGALYFKDEHPLDLYYGIGGRMEFAGDIEIGIRVPVGLAYNVEANSADIFGEVAPIFDVLTKTGIELHLIVGARYYF